MSKKIEIKRVIAMALVLFLALHNITYAQNINHWAKKNYKYFRQKNIFKDEESIDFDRDISLGEFKGLYEQITNQELITVEDILDDEPLTRIDVIRFLSNTLEYEEILDVLVDDYIDSQQIDNSNKQDIDKVLSLGIINGYSDNTLRIYDKLTLGEAITIIKRVNDLETISSINRATVNLSEENLKMGSVGKATNNTVSLFIYGSLLNEKLLTMDIDEVGIQEWIKIRDEAVNIWEKVYKSSMTMSYATDKYIHDVEEIINNSITGSTEDSLKWAQKITEQFDAIKNARKMKEFSKQLGVDAKKAFEILKLSQSIIEGEAIEEEVFYANLELIAKATKTASKVGLFIGGTMITAGLSTAAAGYLTLGEGVGVVVSGLDVVLDVSSTASTIIVGENGKLTMTLEEMKDDYAPVSAIFGLPDLGGLDYGNKLFYVGEQIIDFVYEDKILGIKISNDSEDGNIDYVQIPLKDGKIPKEFFESDILDEAFMKEYQELFSDIIYEMDYENDEDIYSDFNDLTYEDIDNMLEQLDMSIEEFDMIYDELIKEIEEIENRPIDEILDEIEKQLLEEDESIEEEQDIDNDDNDNNNYDDNNDEKEDLDDSDELEDIEDSEDPDESEDTDNPEDEIYYTLTVYYVLEFDDEDVILPPTFEKKDYKYGDKYNIPAPKIEGYTPDKDTVEGTIGRDDETVIVSYMKDYEPYKVLLIEYVIDDEKVEAPEPYIDGDIKIGQEYNIPSPTVEGYYTDNPVVSGIMEEGLNQVIVTYYNNDKYYTVTIRYVFADEDGNELGEAKATETREVKVGDSYTIIAPEIDGYYPDLEKYTAIMGDVGNMNYTIKYREKNTTEYVISGLVDLDIIKIPEGKSLEESLAYLPEKVPVYINAGNNTIEINVVWKENSERSYPTVDEVIGKYPYTGSYEFQGEFNLPENVINPSDEYMEFVPKITVEAYPVVEDSYNIGVDYSQLEREINGTLDDYSVWYEDSYGEKQGLWEHYVNGYIYERYVYKDNYYNGLHEEFAGDNNGKTKEAYYQYGYDEVDKVYRSWLEGSYKTWYYNGKKKSEGQFSKGNKTGEWQEYHDDETLASKGSYSNDLMEGHWKYYYENRKIEYEGSYEYGKQVGLWIYYNEDGSIDYKWNYTTQE